MVFSFFLLNEYKLSQYTLTKNKILSDIYTINPSINPAAITNRFVFLSRVDITSNTPNLADNIIDSEVFQQHKKAVVLNRKVSICTRPKNFFAFNNEWRPATQETKYSPDITKTIYKDIRIGNFTIAEDILNKKTKMDVLLLSKNNIFREYPNMKKNNFIYTYIGHGWFYHMNKGNVTRTMMKMTKSYSIDMSQVLSILLKIVLSVVFHSIFYVSSGSMGGGTQITNQDRINILMSNCNENDVRIRYLYYAPKGKISIVAFKDRNLLMTKEINGFNFGNYVPGSVKSPEDVIPMYPQGFQEDSFDIQKICLPILALILLYTCGSRNKYKRDISIVIFGSLVILIRSSMWNDKYKLIGSFSILIASSIVYKFV